jgi:ribosome biogenesis GTPase
MELTAKDKLQHLFKEFEPFLGQCRFPDCAHVKEHGCAVLEAVKTGVITQSRHSSYIRLYEQAKQHNDSETKKT